MRNKVHKSYDILMISFIVTITIIALFFANRDIFHFEYIYGKEVIFDPHHYTKSEYSLTDNFFLKPGNYTLSFRGEMNGKKSSLFLMNDENEKIISMEFIDGEKAYSEDFSLSKIENVHLGVSYDPDCSILKIERIKIESPKVIYRDSIIRHVVISVFILIIALKAIFLFLKRSFHLPLLFICIFTVIICLPYFTPDYFLGDDLFFHLNRIMGIAQTLKAGYFPARNQLFWLQNYGYGVGYFYPDLFLYVPALLCFLGFSLLGSYKIFMTVVTFFSLLSFYFTTREISKRCPPQS